MFEFLEPGCLVDGELELVLSEQNPPEPERGWLPSYVFKMTVDGSAEGVGRISLRIDTVHQLDMYAGQMGYRVEPAQRGRHYAARSVKLLLPLARAHGMQTIWITCNPDNIASRRSCELAGADLVESVDIPVDDALYLRGDRQKCRYRIEL